MNREKRKKDRKLRKAQQGGDHSNKGVPTQEPSMGNVEYPVVRPKDTPWIALVKALEQFIRATEDRHSSASPHSVPTPLPPPMLPSEILSRAFSEWLVQEAQTAGRHNVVHFESGAKAAFAAIESAITEKQSADALKCSLAALDNLERYSDAHGAGIDLVGTAFREMYSQKSVVSAFDRGGGAL